MMKALILTGLALALTANAQNLAPPARSSSSAAALDLQVRGRQIVDDAIQALGGDKFLTVQNRVESGRAYSFFNDSVSGLSVAKFYTRYVPADKPGEQLAQQERQGLGKDEFYYNILREEGGWEVTFRGPKRIEKDQVGRHHESTLHNIFYILRNRLHEPGLIFESKGGEIVDNMPVNMVDVIDAQNRVVTVAFHQSTKLPVQQTWLWRDVKTRERNEEVTRFSRYRDVAGTQWPFQMHRERNGSKIYEMFADNVVINQNLSEDLFAIPDDTARPSQGPQIKKEKKKK
ncbi:MAG: hypothetical protein ABI824_02745 [Acidobacteriota bacterium]